MLKSNLVQQRLDLIDGDLPVGGGDVEEFAAGELLRRAAFIDVYVGRMRTNDRVMRGSGCFESQNICAGAAKNEKDFRFFSELAVKELDRVRRVRIVAVSNDVTVVSGGDGLHDFRVYAGVVVAGETAGSFNSIGHDKFVFRVAT